ncbi:MAG TPA: alpha/beta hydrolase-fold protein [Steroidobacteraceae bacterium]|nr:alpha/beta hydrolase-fold protein [Steroidobacteraceae bacterium]
MMPRTARAAALTLVFASSVACAQLPQRASQHLFFRINAGAAVGAPVSGRLLVFIARGSGAKAVSIDEFHPDATWVAAREVHDLAPGAAVEIDTDAVAYPQPFSKLAPGDYQVQAVLDVDHTYNYSGLGAGDLISPVLTLKNWAPGEGAEPELALSATASAPPPRYRLTPADLQAVTHLHLAVQRSAALSRFWGRPTFIRAWVVLPPDYDQHPSRHYPTVYWTHGYGGDLATSCKFMGTQVYERMAAGKMPPMIWVMLDEHLPTGTHEFADSVNNGPWGTALTREYIPWLESHYRTLRHARDRFLQGHSSGGWATLQLEVDYPRVFGGTWSTSPDPSDFHDFTGVNLYSPHANVYHRPDGSPYPLVRMNGQVIASFGQFAQLEDVLGPYGGQMASFDWVFSPRSADGSPEPMFDRATGDVDPKVLAYWSAHYDLARIVKTTWAQQGPYLRGRIHVYVGTADTFYLDGAAHRFDAVLRGLGADAHFTYRAGRSHFDLYATSDDRYALIDTIAAQMYLTAYPGAAAKWKSLAAMPFP